MRVRYSAPALQSIAQQHGWTTTRRRCRGTVVVIVASACMLTIACGKKGPPLAPLAPVPTAVDKVTARRLGNDVYVTLLVPAQNLDATTPADVARVEVYGFTGSAPPSRDRFLAVGTQVAVIPVAAAPDPDNRLPAPDRARLDGARQGAPVTVVDALRPEDLRPAATSAPATPAAAPAAAAAAEAGGPVALRRYYMAFAASTRGRPGPPGPIVELPLLPPPPAPTGVSVTYTADAALVSWHPPGGLFGFLFESALPMELPPADDLVVGAAPPEAVSGPARYNVYRQLAPDPLAPPATAANPRPWGVVSPAPINPAPLPVRSYQDPVEFGRERCYMVRVVRGTAPAIVEGEASAPVCVTPVDTFPPPPPGELSAIASEGAINLLWEASAGADVAGYLVLRGEQGSATLHPLTPAPVTEPRFTDRTVTAGVRYVYAIVAVDSRVPVPNVSAESNRVEEVAR